MLTTTFFALAPLAAANPITPRAYPPRQTSSGFTLIANLTDPTKSTLFNDPINHWSFGSVHVGAGLNTAILTPPTHGHILFVNGTGRDVSAEATSISLPPLETTNGLIPWGVQFSQYPSSTTPESVYLGVNFGYGSIGAGIRGGLRSPWPVAFAPLQGKWMVCNESAPTYGRPQYPVRIAQEVPENCAEMTLLAQCATLPVPLLGVEEFGYQVMEVDCYEDVKGIEWGRY